MGWNTLRDPRPAPAAGRARAASRASTSSTRTTPRPTDPSDVAAEADYPGPFAAMVWRDNLVACQFHPEKSQRVGLAMYANFAAMA